MGSRYEVEDVEVSFAVNDNRWDRVEMNADMLDFILRGLGLTGVVIVVVAISCQILFRNHSVKVGILYLYRLAPVIVLGFCCAFFWHAFEVCRMPRVNCAENIDQGYGLSSDDKNNVEVALFVQKEKVVREEHDAFRAELGTWLAIFGLLSILASILGPIASYKFQSMAGDEERRKQTVAVENVRKQAQNLLAKVDAVKYDLMFMQAGVCLASLTNSANASLFRRGLAFLSDILGNHKSVEIDKGMSIINLLSSYYCHYGAVSAGAKREYMSAMKNFIWRFTLDDVKEIFNRASPEEKKEYRKQYECACGSIKKLMDELGKSPQI